MSGLSRDRDPAAIADGISLTQFRSCLGNGNARKRIGLTLSDDEAALILADTNATERQYRSWLREVVVDSSNQGFCSANSLPVSDTDLNLLSMESAATQPGSAQLKKGRRVVVWSSAAAFVILLIAGAIAGIAQLGHIGGLIYPPPFTTPIAWTSSDHPDSGTGLPAVTSVHLETDAKAQLSNFPRGLDTRNIVDGKTYICLDVFDEPLYTGPATWSVSNDGWLVTVTFEESTVTFRANKDGIMFPDHDWSGARMVECGPDDSETWYFYVDS